VGRLVCPADCSRWLTTGKLNILMKEMQRKQVREAFVGIFPPVLTPYNNRAGEIDESKFCQNLGKLKEAGLSGVVVAGSTGEAPYLSSKERLRLTRLARRSVKPPQLLIVGTGLESTRGTIELGRQAVECGADALLVITPNYYKSRMSSEALIAYYRTVAESVHKPVIIYHIPQFTGIRMEPDAIAELSKHPNIIGLKESSGDLAFVRSVLRSAKENFHVLVGSAMIIVEAIRAGARGGILGQADIAPELCLAVYEAAARGDWKRAKELHAHLLPLATKISVPFGVAGVKYAAEVRGFFAGPPRGPLRPLTAKDKAQVEDALRESSSGLDL
jgi:4-hydroxy-2-oxoglutarate aldolase